MPGPVEPYELCEYETEDGHGPFSEWLRALRDRRARAKIDARLARVRLGNLGDYQSVGEGVYELRIFHGPGYRVYFSFDGGRVILLLCGGDKSSQLRDIAAAQAYRIDYQRRDDDNG